MKQNKGYIAEQQTDPVLPGWMSAVLFNFDEPEETTSFIQAVAKLHTANNGRVVLPTPANPPAKNIKRRN
jgi:hypothetical protein